MLKYHIGHSKRRNHTITPTRVNTSAASHRNCQLLPNKQCLWTACRGTLGKASCGCSNDKATFSDENNVRQMPHTKWKAFPASSLLSCKPRKLFPARSSQNSNMTPQVNHCTWELVNSNLHSRANPLPKKISAVQQLIILQSDFSQTAPTMPLGRLKFQIHEFQSLMCAHLMHGHPHKSA